VVRRALAAERPGVVETVVAAFAHDPAWSFLLGEEYDRLAPRFAGALFDLRVPAGNVWVADDLAAVAMWRAPSDGDSEGAPVEAEQIWIGYREAAGAAAFARLIAYNQAVSAVSPAGPFWYLGVLATHPARRREGLAIAALAPVLAAADRAQVPCCLETSTEANRRFYERRGFVEATEVSVAGGPPTWWLRRPPQ
jgi:GNAT superfamily N-acetyltransferase